MQHLKDYQTILMFNVVLLMFQNNPPTIYFRVVRTSKLAVVNDRVYIGGPSFEGADRKDMAVVMEDKSTADWLYRLAVNIT